jgi:hypothetical protein
MPKTHFQIVQGSTEFGDMLSKYLYGAPVGNVFFVNSVTGVDSVGAGLTPDGPVATLDYAIGLCTANNGDHIIVMPGHTETIIAAAGVAADVAGITIIGMGYGRKRPVINYTTAVGASLDVTAANVRIENLVFTPIGFDAITAAINVSAADCQIVNCEFELANATNQAVLGILTTAAANRLLVQNCHFHGTSDAGTTAAICIVGGTDIRLENNIFIGAYSSGVGAIQQITTTTVNAIVKDNIIQNLTASNTKAMVFTASSTGQIAGNQMQILSGTAPITGAAMSWVGRNAYAAAIATAGTAI